jgi:Ohr subfamily peroxiredoxin
MTLETLEKGKVQYTAKTHTTGGRAGASRSDDGRLDVKLSIPGASGNGTNPEQLFAAGWSACFEGAMGLAARKMKIIPGGSGRVYRRRPVLPAHEARFRRRSVKPF